MVLCIPENSCRHSIVITQAVINHNYCSDGGKAWDLQEEVSYLQEEEVSASVGRSWAGAKEPSDRWRKCPT
jgi:hypothetical protein